MIKLKKMMVLVVLGLFWVGCGGNQGEEKKKDEVKINAAPKKDESEIAPKGLSPEQAAKVVAKVGDHTITVGEVTEQINRLSPYIRRRWAAPEKRREFLQKLIRVELLSQEAARLGLDADPEVQRTVKQVMIRLLIKNDLEKDILPNSIDDKVLKEEYQKEYDKYHRPAQIRASHILLADEQAAKDLIAELDQNKGDRRFFRQKAKELSIDENTNVRGGDIGYFSKPEERRDDEPDVPKALASACWKLEKIGDVAPQPIKTDQGYHVVKLTNRKPVMDRSFESVKRLLENRVLRKMRREGMAKFVDGLKAKAKIELFEDNLAKIKVKTKPSAKETNEEEEEDVMGLNSDEQDDKVNAADEAPEKTKQPVKQPISETN